METEDELQKRVQHAKTLKELDALEHGQVIRSKQIPTLAERLQAARQRQPGLDVSETIAEEIKNKRIYLEKKKRANTIATVLTAIVSSFGVGLTAGIAMVLILPLIWPAISMGAMIGALIGFTFFGSFTEFFVYRGYVKAFCQRCVRGFFNSIDNKIYQREAAAKKKLKHATKYDLSETDKKELNKQFQTERIVKRILLLCCIPLAIGAGIGFMGLVFSQVMAVLPLLGVLAGGVYIAAFLAILTGPIFAMVMYGMLDKAVEINIFAKMRDHIKKALLYQPPKDQPDLTYSKLKWTMQLAHFLKCLIKVIGVVAVLGVSFLATAFTAQAWLESSIGFFAFLGKKIAEHIGSVVGLIFLGVNYCFSVDKGLQTIAALFVPFIKLGSSGGR